MMILAVVAAAAASLRAGDAPGCRAMRSNRAVGEIVSVDDTILVPCKAGKVPSRLRYDPRRKVTVARDALVVGDDLGRAWLPAKRGVVPGDTVRVEARIGHVKLTRQLTAMQAAVPGERFFVRDAQGRILVAPVLAAEDGK